MHAHEHPSDQDLLLLSDRELSDARASAVQAHLDVCEACHARQEALARVLTDTVTAIRTDRPQSSRTHRQARAALEIRLARESTVLNRPWAVRARAFSASVARWSTAAAAIVAVLLVARALRSHPPLRPARSAASVERDALPIAALTPGATAHVTLEQICRGEVPRPAPADPIVRDRVVAEYGMAEVPAREYELDYLITPELGGATDPQNLWPERYSNRTWNAKVKDQLEDLLPALVCEGKIDLRTAQQDIAANWVAAYKKYFKTDVPLAASTRQVGS